MKDTLSQYLDSFLRVMAKGSPHVREVHIANIDILLTMLGDVDKEILMAYYGLWDVPQTTVDVIADRYQVDPEIIIEVIEKDLHIVAITPEWQTLREGFSDELKQILNAELERNV